jgi:hypothetical protein
MNPGGGNFVGSLSMMTARAGFESLGILMVMAQAPG